MSYTDNGKYKRYRRERTSEGLTNNIQWIRDRRSKRLRCNLNMETNYIQFVWVEFMSKDYFKVIESINDCYKKMLEIGKCKEVFRPDNGRLPDILTAKTKDMFSKAKKNIVLRYNRYVQSGAPRLTISIDTYIVPDPRKYANSTERMPTERDILVMEEILEHEFITNNLNIVKCIVCLECHMQSTIISPGMEAYTCKKCLKRKDNDYYLKNNLHPVWFEVNEDGSYKLDEAGKKIPHFEVPHELKRLTVAERLLIRRCATFVPSVHLSNGTFALKGHCVTFPQDIAKMCDELPHRKEEILVFVRYIGNKDTTAVYPKSMRVNRRNVIDALNWLKKHNPHYSNVTITESNLDWMKGNDEANLGQEGTILSTKTSQRYKVMTTQEETISYAHRRLDFSGCAGNTCDIEIGSMHPNKGNTLPNAHNTEIIQSLIDIATNTDQASKVMSFPSIDHDNPVK